MECVYPDGLSGYTVMKEARILEIADVMDIKASLSTRSRN